MKKRLAAVVAVCLALCLAFSGCAMINLDGYFQQLGALLGGMLTPLEQMEYTRPDMERFHQVLEDCCQKAESETDLQDMVSIIYAFYDEFDAFYTSLALSMIYYSKDQTDRYWETEYNFCSQNSAQVDAALDRFYRTLAKSPLREDLEADDYFGADYFDSYDGDSIYDDYFTELMNHEAALENQYFSLIARAAGDFAYTREFYDAYGADMTQILVDLVKIRQAQADYAGYTSYAEFAYEFFYARDYSVAQTTSYLADIRAELSPLYQQILEGAQVKLYSCTQEETVDYVQRMAQAMGGEVFQAFTAMDQAGLYDLTVSENKLDASYEVFIRRYNTPYVFINPTETEYDKLTFAHEFGHFCKDYVGVGGGVGVDVAEIFSQGMEYLSLHYGLADENLTQLKLLDSLCVYVEQAAYASFEQQLYSLTEDALTAENIQALYDRVCNSYGMNGGFTYLFITHFFTEPMYVVSYVVSNDAALQLYQMEQDSVGKGLACLKQNLYSTEPYFLAFLEEAGLESPFAVGHVQRVKETLQNILKI